MWISDTTTRVQTHTPEDLNQRIQDKTRQNVMLYGANRETIENRLRELDREWDMERMLEANASTLVLAGLFLGFFYSPWFYLLSFLVAAFLLQHSIQGWCPPIRLFRRLGFRTHSEIAGEHYALRLLRGDFDEWKAGAPGENSEDRRRSAFQTGRW